MSDMNRHRTTDNADDHLKSESDGIPKVLKDPICGMEFTAEIWRIDTWRFVSTYKGKEFYFCSYTCQSEFEKSPEKYVSPPSLPE